MSTIKYKGTFWSLTKEGRIVISSYRVYRQEEVVGIYKKKEGSAFFIKNHLYIYIAVANEQNIYIY